MLNRHDWKPVGIDKLEPNAWEALHCGNNCIITAGPGAGKTEFLTQKALFLLQTRKCVYPQRILAISFKKDAAKNLRERVLLRSNTSQAGRFDSMTFDAFAKSILDRFIQVIPEEWRPNPDYKIVSLDRNRLTKIGETADFEKRWLSHIKLGNTDAAQTLKLNNLWNELKVRTSESQLTYTMINRLAEYILRLNPAITRSLRATYPYVFMDEFQDTTYSQYDFIKTAFYGSESMLTAVGDNKQRIMLWAGAMPDAFCKFKNEFQAQPFTLVFNHRSRPELVNIQHIIAKALDPNAPLVQSQANIDIEDDFTGIWQFDHENKEAEYLANWLHEDMIAKGLTPRDYCFLTRQKPEDVELILKPYFDNKSLFIRNESRKINNIMIQDIFSEDITSCIIDFLKLLLIGHEPDALNNLYDIYDLLNAVNTENERAVRNNHKKLDNFIKSQIINLQGINPSNDSIKKILVCYIDFLDLDKIKSVYPQYSLGTTLVDILKALFCFMAENLEHNISWMKWLHKVTGQNHIPLMTIHKSKGLEFHSVIFLRLDDEQWWSYNPNNPVEGRATFFVALSRAKQRVFFTYCKDKRSEKVNELYLFLKDANINIIDI